MMSLVLSLDHNSHEQCKHCLTMIQMFLNIIGHLIINNKA